MPRESPATKATTPSRSPSTSKAARASTQGSSMTPVVTHCRNRASTMLPRASSTVPTRGARRLATRWASHTRTWLSDSLFTRTTSASPGSAATDSTRPSSSQSRSPPANPGSTAGRAAPSPRSRRSRPSRSSTPARAPSRISPPLMGPQCTTGVSRDRTVPGRRPGGTKLALERRGRAGSPGTLEWSWTSPARGCPRVTARDTPEPPA